MTEQEDIKNFNAGVSDVIERYGRTVPANVMIGSLFAACHYILHEMRGDRP